MEVKNSSKEREIRELFQDFYTRFSYLQIEQLIEYFACFGGIDEVVELDPFKSLEENISDIYILGFDEVSSLISPSYILDRPYRNILIATARGDGKILNIIKRAKLTESVGGSIINDLTKLNILRVEESREVATWDRSKGAIKKELRGYRIQSKVRFKTPYLRFWFGFLEPYRAVEQRDLVILENFRKYRDKSVSLIFEQLSNLLLEEIFKNRDPIISKGSLWDRLSEFDLFCRTKSGKVLLGECKFKAKKVSKGELNKLKEKAIHSNLDVDKFILFSKNGFSLELQNSRDRDLMLFDAKDFKRLLKD